MNKQTRICLLGFGEVGQTLATDLIELGFTNLIGWDLKFFDSKSELANRARSMRVEPANSAQQAAAGASLVLSAVTAAQDVPAAQSMAAHLERDTLFVDLNSASPKAKQLAQTAIHAGVGKYVEGVVMAPIGPKRIASPILVGGPHAREFAALAPTLGFSGVEVFSDTVGQASAAKMCRSVVIKGLEALLTESLLSARQYGVEDTVIQSLQNLLPGHDWRAVSQYMISRSMLHGVRRAEEMREVAVTVQEAGVAPWMSTACAERQHWAAQFRSSAGEPSLQVMLDRVLATLEK